MRTLRLAADSDSTEIASAPLAGRVRALSIMLDMAWIASVMEGEPPEAGNSVKRRVERVAPATSALVGEVCTCLRVARASQAALKTARPAISDGGGGASWPWRCSGTIAMVIGMIASGPGAGAGMVGRLVLGIAGVVLVVAACWVVDVVASKLDASSIAESS